MVTDTPDLDAARAAGPAAAQDPIDVVQVCRDLIRFDTSNPGQSERPAAEYVASRIADCGLEPTLLENAPGRTNVVVRVAGEDSTLPAMLVHSHLDTVPAVADEWTHHPLSGEIVDGQIWGRGAVDMKNAVAMYLAALSRLVASGRRPRRDIVFAFVADEEAGGRAGAGFLVHEHPELFDGCEVAIGEVGGFNMPAIDGTDVFTIAVADKGLRWYRLRQRGVAGHGSMIAKNNPITALGETLGHVAAATKTPIVLGPMRLLAEALAGQPVDNAETARDILLKHTGVFRPMIAAALRNTVNATRLDAGYKENVIPSDASATLDCRYLPGHEDELHHALQSALPPQAETTLLRRSPATEPAATGHWFDQMAAALRSAAPSSRVAPYVFSGGTDNKWFAELGMATFGFTPLLLPAGFDFPAMFHGVDERVPLRSLTFGVDVLTALFTM